MIQQNAMKCEIPGLTALLRLFCVVTVWPACTADTCYVAITTVFIESDISIDRLRFELEFKPLIWSGITGMDIPI